MNDFRIVPAGDSVVIVEFEDRIDPVVNARAIAVCERLQTAAISGIRDVVPTYRAVAVYYDPLRTDYDNLRARLEHEAGHAVGHVQNDREPVRVPVCYGDDLGPDLGAVAAFARMTEADVIRLHTSSTYRVFMLGFVPGFAYMGLVDARIAVPRHSTPRVRVPVGSVGIAGVQTGIYPAETPGGWQLIGRTPLKVFDASRDEPCLVRAGDAVQFFAIDRDEFRRWA